jgi:subtilisin family serine protease
LQYNADSERLTDMNELTGNDLIHKQPPSRPGWSHWLLLLVAAGWLAASPLLVTAALAALTHQTPPILAQLELLRPAEPALPLWAFGLLTIGLTLSLSLLAFVPLWLATRRPGREFLHSVAQVLVGISLFQALNAIPALIWPPGEPVPPMTGQTLAAATRLALGLVFLLLGLGWFEAQRYSSSLRQAWRRVGLRLWLNPSALWLALASAALIVFPWVLVGSLGSPGATLTSLLRAAPGALNEEILFRGFALAWLWRASRGRTPAAVAGLILFVAAQGGAVLPHGDWGALLRFGSALLLGLLATELTVRAGGSVWPAVVVHFLYTGFALAFVDPRSQEEVLHWLVRVWMPLAAGGVGFALWLGRKLAERLRPVPSSAERRRGWLAAAALAIVAWTGAIALYLGLGSPGFHPDGFLIVLEEQADLSAAASIDDPAERRIWVYRTLVETAERSQAPVRAELERRGIAYRPHYLINMLEIQKHPGLRRTFARQAGVAHTLFQPGMRRYPFSFTLPDIDPAGPRGVEWNVREIGADRVWEMGYTGQDLVVGDADTGVDWQHPALRATYLGWDGEVANHDYHWYDAWDGRPEPWDDTGHGTHTTGTMTGRDGENQIGVAPDARWIACRNMRHGLGNPGSYLSCMEFLLAPFPLEGDPLRDGDPARGAHLVNNSWGCPAMEGCQPDTLRIAAENLRAAGQMMVVSAGNEGPACGTVEHPPALYDAVFSVGAVQPDDTVAGFSSRGPVTVDNSRRPTPDIVAPGVDIRSSVPGGYTSSGGTSMAGPHVAGAVALLWSADPNLIGDVDRTEALLTSTAHPLTVDAICPGGVPPESLAVDSSSQPVVCGCGTDTADSVPNQIYGWGQLDVWAAVQAVLEGQPDG